MPLYGPSLTPGNNLSDIRNASAARANLGVAFAPPTAYGRAIPATMPWPPTIAVAGPGGASPIAGGSPTLLPYNTAQVTFRGVRPVLYNQLGTNYYQNQANGQTGSGAPPSCVEFDYDGSDVAMRFRAATSSVFFWTWIDGSPATPAPINVTTDVSPGSYSYYRVTFTSRAIRRIRIFYSYADFGGLDIGKTDSVWATPVPPISLAIVGDSWAAGAAGVDGIATYASTLGRILDVPTYVCAFGGTGYSAAGSFEKFGGATRLAALAACNPTHVLVVGSINDASVATATVSAEAAAFYAAIKASLPNVRLVVAGVQPVTAATMPYLNNNANNTAVLAAASAAGATPIDISALGWFTGTGQVGTTANDGNRDVYAYSDGTHPTQAGHNYLAMRLASALRPVLS